MVQYKLFIVRFVPRFFIFTLNYLFCSKYHLLVVDIVAPNAVKCFLKTVGWYLDVVQAFIITPERILIELYSNLRPIHIREQNTADFLIQNVQIINNVVGHVCILLALAIIQL